ncbi:MAG TPA: CocE/NonD family hydrolase, partial [Dehalococcoidia bacterium]|nr:CocE/NonD family hydrolase [Dehalococcoidia bacterium]
DQSTHAAIFGAEPPFGPLARRPDILVFATEPLTHDLEVTGPITVQLWVSSSAPDTDFTAKLIDVYAPSADYPNGYALNISDSIKRLRFHNGYEREEFVEPGDIIPLTIELYPTSNLFVAGHRIRLDISSSNFPRFDINPNSGEPIGRHTQTRVARNTIYHDASHPSRVDLPILPGA